MTHTHTCIQCTFPRWFGGKESAWQWSWEDPLEEMAAHSSILAWKIPWAEEPGELQSMESQRVGHDWVTDQRAHGSFDFVTWEMERDFGERGARKEGPSCSSLSDPVWIFMIKRTGEKGGPNPLKETLWVSGNTCCWEGLYYDFHASGIYVFLDPFLYENVRNYIL